MWTWSGSQQRQTLSWKYSSGFDDFLKNLLEKGSLNRHKIQFSVDLSPTKYFHGFLKAHQTDATLITSRTQNPLKMHDFQPIYILIKNTFWSSGQSTKHGLISPIILKFIQYKSKSRSSQYLSWKDKRRFNNVLNASDGMKGSHL